MKLFVRSSLTLEMMSRTTACSLYIASLRWNKEGSIKFRSKFSDLAFSINVKDAREGLLQGFQKANVIPAGIALILAILFALSKVYTSGRTAENEHERRSYPGACLSRMATVSEGHG